ncbi:hypothetical protein [Krasilnikovia sp. MM14-A1004]|uniref:hypothetical protein n=1 Tax=Krasilnikovia sp. MM14-A1004 TaxID=3373541 RepID=UPI00399D207D
MSETLLEAGAVLPGPSRDAALDDVTARSYRHPVLDGRVVVRLVGAAVGPAEDLTMEFLGFAPATEPVPVGHGQRRALGFPAWALVHDPANGRHALALVKEMEKLARTARSKPGNAKDGYDGLAVRLGAAAPQFLPTFWEQAGRAFIAADNPRMAGTCFTAARRAEQVHGLVIDEDRVRDVHLEFAFAGALTAAMLTEYTRGVVGRRTPAEAYDLVKTLALRRVAGGLPPHASIAADLARLARAAGLDPEREADAVVTQLLTYPATVRARLSVWKAYRPALVRLGRRDSAVRARLLEIFPEPADEADITDQWLELLEATGAAADLATGPATRWLERFLGRRRPWRRHVGRNVRLLTLVERLIPRLVAEGGVRMATSSHVDVDVLDLCLAGGVPAEVDGFHLIWWVQDEEPGRRELTAIAADPRLRPQLREAVRSALSSLRNGEALTSPALPQRTLEQLAGAAGIRDVLVELLAEQCGRAGGGTVAGLDADLTELAPLWSPAGMAYAPDGFRQLLDVDLAAVLARTLRAGQLAELCWPAYEAAAKQKKNIRIGTAWPELVVHDDVSAHVITPDDRSVEHHFRYPGAGHPQAPAGFPYTFCMYVDGDLLMSWHGQGGMAAHWTSRPADLLDVDWPPGTTRWGEPRMPLPVPGGGVTTGVAPVHAGDARGPGEALQLAGDGQAYWRYEYVSGEQEWRWREFDPGTGNGGRVSMPAFFAAAAGGRLVGGSCALRPAPPEFAGSPLGWQDGLVGWRTTVTTDGVEIGEGVDGRRVTFAGRPGRRDSLVGAVTLPGAPAPLPVTQAGSHLSLWTADGEFPLATHVGGSPTLPPLLWWHALRTRDAAGSAALRAIDDRTAAALLAVDDTVTGTVAVQQAAEANVAAHLPAVTDPVLRSRIAEVVARAVQMRRRIAEIPRHLDARPDPAARPLPPITDEELEQAWDGLCEESRRYYFTTSRYNLLEHARMVGALLGAGTETAVPSVNHDWTSLLAGLGGVAFRAASPVTGDADRAALAAFLAVVDGTPLSGDDPPLRVLELLQDETAVEELEVHRDGAQVTVLFPAVRYFNTPGKSLRRNAVQVAAGGAFSLPDGTALEGETRPSGRLGGARLRAFRTLLAERGPAPWRPEAVGALTAATGMSRAEAALLLAGMPGVAKREANFLTAAQRAVLGVAVAQARVARAGLQALTSRQRLALLDAAMPADPADLWDHGPDVAALADEWIHLYGRRVAVPEDLVAALARVTDDFVAAPLLQAIAAPGPGDWLSTDGRSETGRYGYPSTACDEGEAFDQYYLTAVGVALPWLAYHLRWDDPLRAALPEALRLVRDRLRNPDLLVGSGAHDAGKRPEAGPALVDGDGVSDWVTHHLAPAGLDGGDDPALGFIDDETATALRTLLSDWIDQVVATPDGAVGAPHDPRVSAPHLVDEVCDRYGLDAEAAAYYLQVLALPDPTDKAVQAWNGWKPAQLRRAREALLAADLLVAAKRERAGRGAFLPGGWQPAKPPRMPLETWKQPLYADAGGWQLVTRPLPQLFAAAWARIVAGDVPRYRDLEEKR